MKVQLYGVYLINFKDNVGGEISGRHYGLVISNISTKDKTLLVAPIASKKKGSKYRGGFTIDCLKYQKNPSYEKAFVKIRKIREIDKSRIINKNPIYKLDNDDINIFKDSMKSFFYLE